MRRFEADGLRSGPSPERHPDHLFVSALRTRMLFSCLVDADFLDSEAHFDPAGAKQRVVPTLQAELALRLLLDHLHTKSADGPVNRIHHHLLADCLAAAERPAGFFTLTAPTGSGKTLASLAFCTAAHCSLQRKTCCGRCPTLPPDHRRHSIHQHHRTDSASVSRRALRA